MATLFKVIDIGSHLICKKKQVFYRGRIGRDIAAVSGMQIKARVIYLV